MKNGIKPLIAIAFVLFAINSNFSALNISIVEVAKHFDATIADISFVYAGFIMFFAGFVLVAGRFCDLYGHEKIFLYGLFVFALSSLIGGFAQFPLQVKIASCLQGLGCALLYPSSTALLFSIYPKESKASPMALVATVGGIANTLTPIFIGYFITFLSWRLVFFSNLLPLSITFYLIKELPNSGVVKSSQQFDGLSVALLILMLFSTYYLLDASTSIKTPGVNSLTILIASVILLISVPAFIFHSKRSSTPFIDFSIFKITEFRAAVVSRFFTMGIYIASLFFVTTIIQTHYKYSAFETGLILVPIMLALTFFSMVSGKLANTGRLKQTLLLGLIIIGIGTFLFYVGTTNIYALIFVSIILAVGLALSTPPLATVAISSLDEVHRGVASGVIFTVNMFGALFGLMLANFIIHTKSSTELLSNGYDVAFSDLSLITTILIAPSLYLTYRFIKYK